MIILLLIVVILLILIVAAASIASSAATYNQAQAVVETARAAQISAAGQTASSIAVTILAVLLALVLIAATVAILYLVIRMRRQAEQAPAIGAGPAKWSPGPNAQFRRPADLPALPQQLDPQQLILAMLMANLVQQQPRRLPDSSDPPPDPGGKWGW